MSPCGPIAFAQEASPVRPLVLIITLCQLHSGLKEKTSWVKESLALHHAVESAKTHFADPYKHKGDWYFEYGGELCLKTWTPLVIVKD